jgi:hypothetical protein
LIKWERSVIAMPAVWERSVIAMPAVWERSVIAIENRSHIGQRSRLKIAPTSAGDRD